MLLGACGEPCSLSTLFLIVTMIAATFQTLITTHVAGFEAKGGQGKLKLPAHNLSRRFVYVAIVVMLVSAVLAIGAAAEVAGSTLAPRSLPAVLNVILVVGWCYRGQTPAWRSPGDRPDPERGARKTRLRPSAEPGAAQAKLEIDY